MQWRAVMKISRVCKVSQSVLAAMHKYSEQVVYSQMAMTACTVAYRVIVCWNTGNEIVNTLRIVTSCYSLNVQASQCAQYVSEFQIMLIIRGVRCLTNAHFLIFYI